MEKLNFFDYLGLDQYNSDEDFFYNLPNYPFKIFVAEDSNSYIMRYQSCGETKERVFTRQFFIQHPNIFEYFRRLSL
jgi:hypothetical protein